jgi:GTP1/Obg family GTP-binding protein
VSDFHAELIIDEIHSNVFLNEFSIKRKINPWKEAEIIRSNENFTLDRNFSTLAHRMSEISIRKEYDDKIKIEEISKDCFKDEYYRNLLNELSPSKLKLEKIEPPRFHEEYSNSVININTLISEISLTNEARHNIKKKIEEM